jgi:cell wall-associated NlpC family hydrolase
MQRGDLFCRPQIGDRAAHVAIYLGYGAAIPGSINYKVVESASDGQVEGCVIRDLPSPSTYDPYRLRF